MALSHLIYTGYIYSAQFDLGGKWDGYAPGLRQGWLFHKRIDLSDIQWREFRSGAPALVTVLVVYVALSRVVQHRWKNRAGTSNAKNSAKARAGFSIIFSALFLGYLHGYAAIYVFLLVTANWVLAHAVAGSTLGSVCIWAANIGALIAVRLTDGFPAALLFGQRFSWMDQQEHSGWLKGVMRWHICYNLTVLRMLSFALDLHWSKLLANKKIKTQKSTPPEKEKIEDFSTAEAAAKFRQTTPLPNPSDYSLL